MEDSLASQDERELTKITVTAARLTGATERLSARPVKGQTWPRGQNLSFIISRAAADGTSPRESLVFQFQGLLMSTHSDQSACEVFHLKKTLQKGSLGFFFLAFIA